MKTLTLFSIVLSCTSIFAATNAWFDADIANTASWPTDGSEVAVVSGGECVGVWDGTLGARLMGEEGDRRLALTCEDTLSFTVKAEPEEGEPILSTTFIPQCGYGLASAAEASAKGGFGAVISTGVEGEADDVSFYGIAKDPVGGANAWMKLVGAVPVEDQEVRLEIFMKTEGAMRLVRYAVDGKTLTAADYPDGWCALEPKDLDYPQRVAYDGNGFVASLAGATIGEAVSYVWMSVPPVEGLSITVTCRGRTIRPNQTTGRYSLPSGYEATIDFAPLAGWDLKPFSRTLSVGETDFELGDIPSPTYIPKPGDWTADFGGVYISEFMAKNSKAWTSACGEKESDWIELTNGSQEAVDLSGWRLSDDPSFAKYETIPAGVTIPAGGVLVVCCQKPAGLCAAGEVHVNLGLGKEAGEFVGLADATGGVRTAIYYPAQMKDVSCGFGRYDALDAVRLAFFTEPTPGAANTTRGYDMPTPEIVFSVAHGYKTEAFDVEISCPADPDAPIYYTTNGKSPTTSDTLYTGAIRIDRTTCLRAGVPNPKSILQRDGSATYLFLDDVLAQPAYRGSQDDYQWEYGTAYDCYKNLGFPESNVYSLRLQKLHYGFNPDVLEANGGDERRRVMESMTNGIDTVSLVIDPENLFNAATGIYVNAFQDGREWERLTMIEGISPTNAANDFALAAGLRIRGGTSRQSDCPKHSFRLYFRGEYGVDALEKPIFGSEGASSFDKLDFRTSQNWSLAFDHSRHDTFIHETFLRDAQGALGQPYTRSRYYHLYINGVYWGLYETQERADEDYAETYLGGNADDYDVIKRSIAYSDDGNVLGTEWNIAAGTTEAYNQLCALTAEGYAGEKSDNYYKAMGLNPDGSRNQEYPILLDDANLMTYILINHYTCNADSPVGFGVGLNNLYAIRCQVDDETGMGRNGFVFLCHDGEHSFGTDSTYDIYHDPSARTGTLVTNDIRKTMSHYSLDFTDNGTSVIDPRYAEGIPTGFFGPAELHAKLMQNAEYRMKFADLVYRVCLKEDGVLTPAGAKALFEKRMAQIDNAISAEYARWDWNNYDNYGLPSHADWTKACAECFEFIDKRLEYLIGQYQAKGWYPSVAAPTAKAEGKSVTIAAQEGATIYYTTDGSDPRLAGGGANETAKVYDAAIPVGADGLSLKVRALSPSGEWSALETLAVEGSGFPPEVPEGATAYRGTVTERVALSGDVYLYNAKLAGGADVTGDLTLHLVSDSKNSVKFLSGADWKVTLDGAGALAMAGSGTFITARKLTIKNGSYNFDFTAEKAKTPAIDVEEDFAIKGGTVVAVIGGASPRFVKTGEKMTLSGGRIEVSAAETGAENARVFKSGKTIYVEGGTYVVSMPGAGSEIFSTDKRIEVSGGVIAFEAGDDCFSAEDEILISGGIVHALSNAGDAIDSNKFIDISGGYVFAFTKSTDHEALDVDPAATGEDLAGHTLVISEQATVVAVSGRSDYHRPDIASTARIYAAENVTAGKKEKYVEFDGVVRDWAKREKTVTTLTVNWNKRHADTFSYFVTQPGYEGRSVRLHDQKPSEVYPDEDVKLNEDVDGVFLRSVLYPFTSGTLIEIR